MTHFQIKFLTFLVFLATGANAQSITDDFEGNGNINSWSAFDCFVNNTLTNPVTQELNNSGTVLEYFDKGGIYCYIYFLAGSKLNIAENPEFSLKIFVPSSSITGNQNNQVTLKLQNSNVLKPWESQTLISKPIILDVWQVISFNFDTDPYVNFDVNSPPPVDRSDFDKILIQVNGENNTDQVRAYMDDFFHVNDKPVPSPTTYDDLIWSDEFAMDGEVDKSKWYHQTIFPVGKSWFSGEIQHYTNRIENSYVADGKLCLIAKQESFTDQGETKPYTSARLNSKFAFKYGRVEIRAKFPGISGTWSAIWMLGKNVNENGAYWQTQGFGTSPWPVSGEIDIAEHWGTDRNNVISAVHNTLTSQAVPGTVMNAAGQRIPTASTDFHVYALEWTSEKLAFSIDDIVHYTYQPAEKNADNWPFDAEHYLLLNFAILLGVDTGFAESAMEVDYVRVYKESGLGFEKMMKRYRK